MWHIGNTIIISRIDRLKYWKRLSGLQIKNEILIK